MLPQLKTAMLAGGLLAFALSFDEVIVTVFTSGAAADAPDLDLRDARAPAELPIVNVVALFVILVSIIPVYFAVRLGGAGGAAVTSEKPARGEIAASVEAAP